MEIEKREETKSHIARMSEVIQHIIISNKVFFVFGTDNKKSFKHKMSEFFVRVFSFSFVSRERDTHWYFKESKSQMNVNFTLSVG